MLVQRYEGNLEECDRLVGQFKGQPTNVVVRVTKILAYLDDGTVLDRKVVSFDGVNYLAQLRSNGKNGDIRTWNYRKPSVV